MVFSESTLPLKSLEAYILMGKSEKEHNINPAIVVSLLFSSISYAQKQSEINKCYNYIEAGDYQRAAEAGNKAVKLYPKDVDAHYCLGKSYYLMGQFNPALEQMKKAEKYASSKKDLMFVYNLIGLIYDNLGDLDNAIMYNSRYMSLARDWEHEKLL